MDTTGLIIVSTGIIKSFFFFFFFFNDEKLMNATVKAEYDKYLKLNEGSSHDINTKEFIQSISDDGFKDNTYKIPGNWIYLVTLSKLKEEFVKFYFKSLEEIRKEYSDISRANDVYNRIGQYIIQLMRLRLVIEPDVQISTNVHPRTNIKYLAIKAYWKDDNGRKVRKFTKSIGRAENYPQGIVDEQALSDGIKLIQPVLFETYKELYKD